MVSAARKRNLLGELRNSDGSVATSESEKGRLAVAYFKGLFSSEHDGSQESLSDLEFPTVVSPQMNMELMAELIDEEIRLTVFSIGPTQAPGPDGLTSLFFQRYWQIIASDVICAVKDIFRRGHMLCTLNHT
ncbi:LINE-1 retrotransposable element ORF2 protein [Linum perenne]